MTAVKKKTCCGMIWAGYHRYACGNGAKFEREGNWYCGIHDPVKIKERQDAKEADWAAEFARKRAQDDAREAARKLQAHKAACFDVLLAALIEVRPFVGHHDYALVTIDRAIAKAKEQT